MNIHIERTLIIVTKQPTEPIEQLISRRDESEYAGSDYGWGFAEGRLNLFPKTQSLPQVHEFDGDFSVRHE